MRLMIRKCVCIIILLALFASWLLIPVFGPISLFGTTIVLVVVAVFYLLIDWVVNLKEEDVFGG